MGAFPAGVRGSRAARRDSETRRLDAARRRAGTRRARTSAAPLPRPPRGPRVGDGARRASPPRLVSSAVWRCCQGLATTRRARVQSRLLVSQAEP
jgi:hypothetical protein